uniref:Uncharacterized protein n=1 Tax=Steinernema glaseri TaxID=37863 RepID=A0A1I8ADB3_9BILA
MTNMSGAASREREYERKKRQLYIPRRLDERADTFTEWAPPLSSYVLKAHRGHGGSSLDMVYTSTCLCAVSGRSLRKPGFVVRLCLLGPVSRSLAFECANTFRSLTSHGSSMSERTGRLSPPTPRGDDGLQPTDRPWLHLRGSAPTMISAPTVPATLFQCLSSAPRCLLLYSLHSHTTS